MAILQPPRDVVGKHLGFHEDMLATKLACEPDGMHRIFEVIDQAVDQHEVGRQGGIEDHLLQIRRGIGDVLGAEDIGDQPRRLKARLAELVAHDGSKMAAELDGVKALVRPEVDSGHILRALDALVDDLAQLVPPRGMNRKDVGPHIGRRPTSVRQLKLIEPSSAFHACKLLRRALVHDDPALPLLRSEPGAGSQ